MEKTKLLRIRSTILVKIRRGPTIVEQKIFDAIRNHGFLADAYEQYKAIKMQWGEDPNLLRDFDTGKLTSTVQCHVVIPIDGFGIFIKEPECVLWELESRKPKLIKADNEYKMIYDTKFIYINSRVKGKYTDFTYGYMYELDPDEDTDKLRIGLAFLKIALRLSDYRISLNEINYAVEDFPRKAMLIWENECCGLLETINWNNIRKFLENFKPSKICELLMWAVDEYAALRMVELGTSWDEIKKLAHRALDYIQRILRLKLKTLGTITIPKPSMELKLLALDILPLTLNDNTYYIITSFDGQNYHHVILRFYGSNMQTSFPTISNVNDLLTTISNAIDKDFKILIYNQKEPLHKIAKSSKTLQMLIKTLEDNNLLIDVHKMTKETLNVDIAPIEELEKYLGLQKRKITLPELRKAYHEAITQKRAETLLEKATEYGKSNAYSTYIVYLILQQKSAN